MNILLNVVHPYTYRLAGSTLFIGGKPEWDVRDKKVAEFIKQTFAYGGRVIYHRAHPADSLDGAMQDFAFADSPLEKFYSDARVEMIVTLPTGCPRVDVRPEKIPKDRWEAYKDYFVSHSELKKIVGKPDRDTGSGLHIFVYELSDGSGIFIGFSYLDKPPLYVTHSLPDGSWEDLLTGEMREK